MRPHPNPKRDPLRQSVNSLALFAMYAAGADGYGIFEIDGESAALEILHSNGLPVPPWLDPTTQFGVMRRDGLAVASYPLHENAALAGSLAFVFLGNEIADDQLSILNRAAVIKVVQALPHTTASLAARIGILDAELAGIKIVERTRGILTGGMPEPEAVETLVTHVEKVLEERQFGSVLEGLLPDLEDQVASRRIVIRAKALLESRHGMSEEQAYLHLRVKSRSSRRRLSEVAREFLAVEAAGRQEERSDVHP